MGSTCLCVSTFAASADFEGLDAVLRRSLNIFETNTNWLNFGGNPGGSDHQ